MALLAALALSLALTAGAAKHKPSRASDADANCNDAFAACQAKCFSARDACNPSCETCPVGTPDDAFRRDREACVRGCDHESNRCLAACEDHFGACVTD